MRSGTVIRGIVVFGVAYLLRLAYLSQIARSPLFDFLQLDSLYYHDWAATIAKGDWLGKEVFEQSPLYPYLLAGYLIIFGHDLWLLRLLQIGAGALTCALTFALGRRLFDDRVGLLAGLGCAVYGPFFFYEGQVMKEFLTPPLATGALLLLLGPRDVLDVRDGGGAPSRHLLRLVCAGILIALAALVRDNFLLLLAVMGAWLYFHCGRRLAPVAALLAGALAVLVPVGLRNHAAGGDFILTTAGGGEVFYIGNGPYANGAYVPPPWVRSNPLFEHEDFRRKARELTGRDLTRGEASHFWWRQGLGWIAANPGRAALLWMRKLALFWNDHELPDNYSFYTFCRFSSILSLLLTFAPVAALAWAGIFLSSDQWRRLLPVYLAGAGYMISVLIFFNFARFRLPLVSILMVLAARGLIGLAQAASGLGGRPGSLRRAVAAAGIAVVAAGFMYVDWSSAAEEPFQDRLHLSAAYKQTGRLTEAAATLREVIADAEAVVRRHGGDPSGAATTPGGVTFVLALSAAHRDLAGVLMEQEHPDEAAAEYSAAAALAPDDSPLHQRLCAALTAAGEPGRAERACRRAVELAPESFTARFDLATVHFHKGDLDAAMTELERARLVKPAPGPLDMADYHYAMGIILSGGGAGADEARAHFTEALRLNPGAPQAADARAYLSSHAPP